LAAFAVLFSASMAARAAEAPYEAFLRVVNRIAEGDRLYASQPIVALEQYLRAQQTLRQLKTQDPSWNATVVASKLKYLDTRVPPMMHRLRIPQPANSPMNPAAPAPVLRVADLNSRIDKLQAEKLEIKSEMAKMETNYTEKLREALKVRPRELEPGELAKVETKNGKLLERIVYLESHYQKLDAEYRKASAELARLQAALATAQRDKSQLQQLVDGKKLQELAAEIAILRRRDEQRAKRVRQLEADIRKLEKLLLANP
jgi:DNA repair exonuclease SbcCD ATPase subunit